MPSTPVITLVVAYAANRAIGKDNTLPWRLPADFAHFKRTTMGHPIVMGRKTWESLGRPLPGRLNVVVTRNPSYSAPGAIVVTSLTQAIAACGHVARICVIGGAQIYGQALALGLADEIIATEVKAEVEGDAFFPALIEGQWQEIARLPQSEENGYAYDFVTYSRVSK